MAKTIMIIDDSASIRQVVSIALKGAGYDVIEACDGKDALNKLNSLNGQKIHLIITDVNMPNMDGITFVTEAKKLPAYKFTPMMMLTTEAADDKKQAGKAAGAKAWLTKPFQPPTLMEAVSKLVLP
jgi:two-component system chemotaxis response regulator CheY